MSDIFDGQLVLPHEQVREFKQLDLQTQALLDEKAAEREERLSENTTWRDGLGAAATQGSVGYVARFMHSMRFQPDPKWDADAALKEAEEWRRLGIAPEQMELLAKATSQESADWLYGVARQNQLAKQEMSRFNVGSQMLLGMADPGMFALDALVAPLGASVKAGRAMNALRAGLVASGENVAFTAMESQYDPSIGLKEGAAAALTGFTLGAPLGMRAGIVAKANRASEKMEEAFERSRPKPTGEDAGNMGAAKVKGATAEDMDIKTPEWSEKEEAYYDKALANSGLKSALLAWRRDINSRFAKSKSAWVRQFGRDSIRDSVGPANKDVTNTEAASVMSKRLERTVINHWNTARAAALHLYEKSKGMWWSHEAAQREFDEQLGRYMRGVDTDDVDPIIKGLANKANETTERMLFHLKENGVPGFEDIKPGNNWLPRVFSRAGFEHVFKDLGLKEEDVAKQLLVPAIRRVWDEGRSAEELADETYLATVDATAKAWVARARKKATGIGDGFNHGGLDGMDLADVRELLEGANVSAEKIDTYLRSLQTKHADKSRVSHARRRIDMDESYTAQVMNRDTGEFHPVAVADFLDNNVNFLLNNYVREMSGWAAMKARLNIGTPAELQHFRERFKQEVRHHDGDNAEADLMRAFDIATNFILGHSTEAAPGTSASRWARVLRDYNFLRSMLQVGFSMVADTGTLFAYNGLRAALREIPVARGMFARMEDGTMKYETARSLMDICAPGTDWANNPTILRTDDIGGSTWGDHARGGRVLNRLDNTQQVLKRAASVMSGMTPVHTFLQRWSARATLRNLMDLAGKDTISTSWRHRMRNWGMSEADQKAIFARLKGKKTIDEALKDYKNWSTNDKEALSAFMWRVTRHQVIEGDVGDSMIFMHSSVGKVFMQFRSFMNISYTGHLLNALHMRDWQAGMMTVATTLFGGLGYSARQYLNTIGDPEARRKRLTLEEIAKAGFQQAAFSSVIPMLMDTVWHDMAKQEAIFRYGRTTGLQSGIMGVPTIDLLQRSYKAAGAVGDAVFNDKPMTERDLHNMFKMSWFNTMTGWRNGVNELIDHNAPEDN